MIYRGIVKGNVVVLEDEVALPEGLKVAVMPQEKGQSIEALDWLKECDEVREAIRVRIRGYAGDSVQELQELRGKRASRI